MVLPIESQQHVRKEAQAIGPLFFPREHLNNVIPELLRVAAGNELMFKLSVAIKGTQRPKDAVVQDILHW